MKEIKDVIETITSGRSWTFPGQQIQAKLYQKGLATILVQTSRIYRLGVRWSNAKP